MGWPGETVGENGDWHLRSLLALWAAQSGSLRSQSPFLLAVPAEWDIAPAEHRLYANACSYATSEPGARERLPPDRFGRVETTR